MKTCTSNDNSQPNQSAPANIYSMPRFRVSLVRENRAAAPSLPISTSVTAAALLAPWLNSNKGTKCDIGSDITHVRPYDFVLRSTPNLASHSGHHFGEPNPYAISELCF